MRESGSIVVDADGHVCEPADLWERELPARLKDRALRLRWNDATGYDEAWLEDWCITDRGLVVNLLARGRSAGIHLSLCTQGPNDWIDRHGDDWSRLTQNTNVAIIMAQGTPGAAELCADFIGTRRLNLLPLSATLCTTMSPPCSRRILRLTGNPSPVPRAPFVLTNGLNTSSTFSAGMPGPLSSTITLAHAPSVSRIA